MASKLEQAINVMGRPHTITPATATLTIPTGHRNARLTPAAALTITFISTDVSWGQEIILFLYDPRYTEAGWMLQILAAGAIVSIVLNSIEYALLAMGDSFRFLMLLIGRTVVSVAAMIFGGVYYGIVGVVVAYSVLELLSYPILVALIRRYGVWLPGLDLGGLAVSAIVVGGGLWLKG